jgi:glycosyltransferase involved in cell wall biosynthesis
MKVFLVHNRYQQAGGEDQVVQSEARLLSAAGYRVVRHDRDNREIQTYSLLQKACLPATTIWSGKSLRDVRRTLRNEAPDIAHFHNTFPLISPAAYTACKEAGVPVVQTLHNYRLLCPAATFLREGVPCELCLGKKAPWPGVVHACYRESRAQTGVVGAMLAIHRAIGTWTKDVDTYIALSEFAKRKFIEGGIPPSMIVVKPNFVDPDPGVDRNPENYALFVGRLSHEKGLKTLLVAWKLVGHSFPLLILGEGPLRSDLESSVREWGLSEVRFGGLVPREAVWAAMKRARFLIVPSDCYENFPTVIIEAFACGLPVIGARTGAIQEILENQQTGRLFSRANPEDLAAKLDLAWTRPREMEAMGRAGRSEYVAKYTAGQNIRMLKEIYERALQSRHGGSPSGMGTHA